MSEKLKKTLPLKIKKVDDQGNFEGYGAVSGNEDLGGDIIAKGAFKDTLKRYKGKEQLPMMFWQHNPDWVPGKWTAMNEDDGGLHVKGVFANTPLGNEMKELVNMGAVSGLSIGFQLMDYDYDAEDRRIIKEIDLWETSIVSIPMNPMARIKYAHSRMSEDGEFVPTQRMLEKTLREAGLSRKVAKLMVAQVPEEQREADFDDVLAKMADLVTAAKIRL